MSKTGREYFRLGAGREEENSASSFGQIRLWTSFESSPVSITSTGSKALLNSILITQNVTTRKFITLKNFWPKTRKIDAFNFYWLKTIIDVTIFLKKFISSLSNQIEKHKFFIEFSFGKRFPSWKKTYKRRWGKFFYSKMMNSNRKYFIKEDGNFYPENS